MKAINLKTEYLTNPVGLDIQHPRLSWNLEGGVSQSAYRIIAKSGNEIIWDSNKVKTSSTFVYFPLSLNSRERIEWKVIPFDETDIEGEESESAFFEMGLLNKNDWQAKWIRGDYTSSKKRIYPVNYFKKEFNIADIKDARLYISACGVYEASINSKRVGEFVFAPGSTDYRKRIQYQVYDVTSLLKNGENKIEIALGDGWYRGSNGAKGRRNTYGKTTRIIAQLEIKDANGKTIFVNTDKTWSFSLDGPILFADLKDGEKVDANKSPSYSGKSKECSFEANLTASNNFQVKERETFLPSKLLISPTGKKILEFPQNLSGYISFEVNAHKGDRIHIVLGEMLDENGELTLKNIQCKHKGKLSPLQEFDYICKEGKNIYKPKFFYGGFKYALIETDIPFEKDNFKQIAVYSAFEETSSFECSNPLLNQFYKNTLWSLKSNSTDFPSDCPTRERMGWTGDSQIFFNTASYLVNYAPFARKHVQDIFDRQWRSGRLPQIAPFANEDWYMWVMNGSVGWACAGVYIPLYYYQKYGDKRLLERYYPQMLRYASFMIKRAGKWGGVYAKHVKISHKNRKYFVNCGQSYGEWAEPDDVCAFVWTDFASPHPEESTAYTYFTLKRVLEVASILNKPKTKELEKIEKYLLGAKKAYQEYISIPKYSLDADRQAKLVRPLYMGLLNEEQEEYAKKRLIKALDNYDWRLGTGFLSTPMILDVLEKIDNEYSYKLIENEEMPGWLYMPKCGATTIWEAWEGNSTKSKGIASLNHYSKGALVEWIFKEMCGIKIVSENTFEISPKIGGNFTYAKGSYQSVYGKIESSWKKDGDDIVLNVSIPTNTKAKIIFFNQELVVGPGKHEFHKNAENATK